MNYQCINCGAIVCSGEEGDTLCPDCEENTCAPQ